MNSVDEAWDKFLSGNEDDNSSQQSALNVVEEVPTCSSIYISTKTIIAYLNQVIDLKSIFWNLDIVPYTEPRVGIVKKQMKFNSTTPEEIEYIEDSSRNMNTVAPSSSTTSKILLDSLSTKTVEKCRWVYRVRI